MAAAARRRLLVMAAPVGPVRRVLSRLSHLKRAGDGWVARCPAHEDERASLSIGVGADRRALLRCHAGCSLDEVLAALHLTQRDLFMPAAARNHGKPTVTATYDYRDASGKLLFQVVRMIPKDFRQRQPNGKGGWSWSTKGVERVLYRLPELLAADPRQLGVVSEGEKDADRLAELGLVATTSPGGAGKWRSSYSEALRGRTVAILPDADDAGRKHAAAVARDLRCKARSVRVVELPGLREHGDVSDWLDAGGTVDQLRQLAARAPESAARPAEAPRESLAPLCVASVDPQEIEWLWPGRLPAGKLVVVDGDPSFGKSTLTGDWCARVTRGHGWPDAELNTCSPAAALLISGEDDIAATIRPRLGAAGAVLERCHVLQARPDGTLPTLPSDVAEIERLIGTLNARLCVIDPITAYLDPELSAHKDQHVRRALAPLALAAERTGCCIVIVRHLTKTAGGSALYRGQGSIGVIAAARVGLIVARDPDDDNARVIAISKCNIAREAPSLRFTLESAGSVARIKYLGTSTHTATSLCAAPATEGEQSALDEAAAFLESELAGGGIAAKQVFKAARDAGISEPTLRRAARKLGVEKSKRTFSGGWEWSLPASKVIAPRGDHLREVQATDSTSNTMESRENNACSEDDQAEDDQGAVITFEGGREASADGPASPGRTYVDADGSTVEVL